MQRRAAIAAGSVFVLVLVLGVLLAGSGYGTEVVSRVRGIASRAPSAPLEDLNGVGQLASAFDRAEGHPRLVLFLSPT